MVNKIYLEKSAEELEGIENKFDFIPVETPIYAANAAMNKIALRIAKDIATTHVQGLETAKLESGLREVRNYAVRNRKYAKTIVIPSEAEESS